MNRTKFIAFHAKLKTLTPSQHQQAFETLQNQISQSAIPTGVKARERQLDRERTCIHCHSKGVVKNRKSAGLTRFRCRAPACKKIYTALTGTKLAHLHRKEKWDAYQDCLRERLTLKQAGGISYATAFNWRHRFIASARDREPLRGVVEMDETYFLESEKGSRSLRKRRPQRKRGGNVGRRGLWPEQRPVITAAARGGKTYACEIESARTMRIESRMADWTASDCIVVSDGHRGYGAASENLNRRHEVVNVGRGNYVRDQVWHLNTVNNRHEVIETIHNRGDLGRTFARYLEQWRDVGAGSLDLARSLRK